MDTQWSYLFDYRAHFHGEGFAEMDGVVSSDRPLSEIEIQQLCVDNLPGHEDMPEGVLPQELVITRFHYVSLEPVHVPDVSQGGHAVSPDTADTDG